MKKYIEQPTYRGGKDIAVFNNLALQPRAEFAASLIERFGAVAGVPDGESSDGRAKLRLQTPAELVARCCEIADSAMTEFEKRGWTLTLPDPVPPKPREGQEERLK